MFVCTEHTYVRTCAYFQIKYNMKLNDSHCMTYIMGIDLVCVLECVCVLVRVCVRRTVELYPIVKHYTDVQSNDTS